jgi:hypothetical protein
VLGGDLPVRPHSGGGSRLAPAAHDDVLRLVAGGDIGGRDVGHLEQDRLELSLGVAELALEARDLLAERATLGDQIVGGLARALPARDFLRARVARRLALLDGLDQLPPIALESLAAVELWGERLERVTAPHRFTQVAEPLADQPHVVHQNVGIESGTSDLYPQLASPTERT